MVLDTIPSVEDIISRFPREKSSLINILNEIQRVYGYLPRDALEKVSEELRLSMTHIYGVVTFYHKFKLQKPGKYHINICKGTACFVKGSSMISDTFETELGIKKGETTPDGLFSMDEVACLGCCALAPAMEINGEVHGKLTPRKVKRIIKRILRDEKNDA